MTVPFNRPVVSGAELEYIREAIQLGQIAGDGIFTERCQRLLVEMTGAPAVLLTHSCTAALEMAAILLDIQPGDEVIMPSFTFVSTANAVVLRQGVPVFVDIRPDTLNIDEDTIEAAVSPRSRAIFAVHYAGVPANMDRINAIGARHGLAIVEDAAQALGSTYKGRPAGSLGHLSAFSFHETKNIVSGEGGAIAINDPSLIERAEIVREKGTNRTRFRRGQVDKYTWVECGSSFLPGELMAAYLFGQLENSAAIQADRLKSWQTYDAALRRFHNRGLATPTIPADVSHNAHLYYIVMPSADLRDEMLRRLKSDGINALFHYVPLHSAPAGRKFARSAGDLTVTDDISARLLRLPLFPKMGSATTEVLESAERHLLALL